MNTERTLRQRVIRGVQAQAFGHVVRVLVQLGGVALLTGVWGLHEYGEWLILAALPTYLALSDIGFGGAAGNEMMMATGRGDMTEARATFQAVARAIHGSLLIALVALPVVAFLAPLTQWLNLSIIDEGTAAWMLILLGLDGVVTIYASLLYGGYGCVGRYGEGAAAWAGVTLVEFCGLAVGVVLTRDPGVAAAGMLASRLIATAGMYALMRRYAPWLRFGKPPATIPILRRLASPALATAAFPAALALNVQGLVVLVGVASSPASAAVFSTLRTVSRAVIQLLSSIFAVVAPEISRAYGAGDLALVRTLNRRACHAALWLATPLVITLAIFGGPLVELWTSGRISPPADLMGLFLATALVDSLWYTNFAVLFATNRQQRAVAYYVAACVVNLPIAYGLLRAWGLNGAALALLLLEAFMFVVVLRLALPAAGDHLSGWTRAVLKPPPIRWRKPGALRPRASRRDVR